MGAFAIGDVVLIPLPLAGTAGLTMRPALVVGLADFDSYVLCQIAARSVPSTRVITVTDVSFSDGTLQATGYVRCDKLFTVEAMTIQKKLGALKAETADTILSVVRTVFSR